VQECTPPIESDIGDGRPGWNPRTGEPLVPGLLAWDRIAAGHHRETWLCWSVALWAPAVVKIVRPGWSRYWTEALDREVLALGNVAHPAVPRLLHDGRESCLPHIGIEYLDGPALDECVEADGPLPAGDIARLGVLVLGALRTLHAAGTAHLDISPYNILLVDRRPRLIDLGTARPLGYELEAGEAIGTDGFLAPEFRDASPGAVTAAVDVYGVGATLASLLDLSSDGADEVAGRLAALTAADPDRRPGVDLAMSSLARNAGTGPSRPWPSWATRHLPPPPRQRRQRTARPTRVLAAG
jgi:serine/threonine protein kinase